MTQKNTVPILNDDDDDHVVVVDEGAEIVLDDDGAAEIVVDDTDPPIAEPPEQAEAPSMDEIFTTPAAPPPIEPAALGAAPPRDANDDELSAAIARRVSEIVELKGQLATALRERDEARAQAIEGAAAVATLGQPIYQAVTKVLGEGRGLLALPTSFSPANRLALRKATEEAAALIGVAATQGRPAQIEFRAVDVSTLAPTKPPKAQPKKKGFFS